MPNLFFLLSLLLLSWILLVAGLIIYSLKLQSRREQRTKVRRQLQEKLNHLLADAGGIDQLFADTLAQELKRVVGNDQDNLRNFLLEQSQNSFGQAQAIFNEAYEILQFPQQDIKALLQGSWYRQAAAALRLGQIKYSSAIEVLTAALQHPHSDVRMAAICALAEIGDARSIKSIVYSLSNADGWQTLLAADRLLQMPADLTRPLLDLLQESGSTRERREGTHRMVLELVADFGQRGGEHLNGRAARNAVSSFLDNESIDLRARAIRAITAVGIETAQELHLIIEKLRDPAWEVRAVAAKALGLLRQESAIPFLVTVLADEAWWVRHNAAHALALFGQRGLQELQLQQTHPDRFAREMVQQVLQQAE
jgi:HEAT repeat protein